MSLARRIRRNLERTQKGSVMEETKEKLAGETKAPESVLVLKFAGPGSTEFELGGQGVTPAQMLVAAAWLDTFARHQFERTWRDEELRTKIAVPKAGLPIFPRNGAVRPPA